MKSILESMIIKLELSDIKSHTMEITKIGNNINQIAYKANYSNLKKEDTEYIKNQMSEVIEIEKQILDIFSSLKGKF